MCKDAKLLLKEMTPEPSLQVPNARGQCARRYGGTPSWLSVAGGWGLPCSVMRREAGGSMGRAQELPLIRSREFHLA